MADTTPPAPKPNAVPTDVFDRAVMDLWWASKRGTVAVVIGLFPFVFIIDERVDLAFSPVLPSLLVLAVLAIVLPFLLMETGTRMVRRRRDIRSRSLKARQTANVLLGIAAAWLVLWLALGA